MPCSPPDAAALQLYEALHNGAALIDLGARTQVVVTGADRMQFLNGFCTGDIKKLQPGNGCEAFITNHQGKAAGHVLVFAEVDRLVLDGAAGQSKQLIAHLDRFVISEQVVFADRSQERADLLLAGPQALSVLESFGVSPPTTNLAHQLYNVAGSEASLRRVDYLAAVACFLLSVPNESVAAVTQSLAAAGAITADQATGDAAWQMARVEAGYPLYGRDITDDNLPQEVQRDVQAISFTKGCYLGQETIARLDALGHVNRVLTGLKLPGDNNLQPGDVIMQGEKKIAQLTSLAWSPKLQAPLALAYVRTLHATPGKRLPIAGGEAEVVKLPLAH